MTFHTIRRKRLITGEHRDKGKLRLSVRFEEAEMRALVAMATAEAVPAAAVVRRAVRAYLGTLLPSPQVPRG